MRARVIKRKTISLKWCAYSHAYFVFTSCIHNFHSKYFVCLFAFSFFMNIRLRSWLCSCSCVVCFSKPNESIHQYKRLFYLLPLKGIGHRIHSNNGHIIATLKLKSNSFSFQFLFDKYGLKEIYRVVIKCPDLIVHALIKFHLGHANT